MRYIHIWLYAFLVSEHNVVGAKAKIGGAGQRNAGRAAANAGAVKNQNGSRNNRLNAELRNRSLRNSQFGDIYDKHKQFISFIQE